jgi:hypothetical protein
MYNAGVTHPSRGVIVACVCAMTLVTVDAQQERLPTARLVAAPRLAMPGAVDSNVPMTWDLVDGAWRLFAFTSWGGIPARLAGAALDQMQPAGPLEITGHPGHGIWIESVIPDDSGAWYGYYHHETPAYECGRLDRSIPRIGSVRSIDRGVTWQDLGILLEAPPGSAACGSANRYVIGGVGDVGAVLASGSTDLFLYYSQYSRGPAEQGVMVARLAWADRDAPVGRVTIWNDGAWLPPRLVREADDSVPAKWEYATGTPLVRATEPWHDGNERVDAFWGPSIHWNTYLERYVMLVNRAKNEYYNNEGIYVSYARDVADPRAWSRPQKILNGGEWYPQVAGLEMTTGTDRQAAQRARFFMTGRSEHYIEFSR